MKSIWRDNSDISTFNTFEGEAETDTLIIGGGLAGVLCAYFLHLSGHNYMLLEGNKICGGVTNFTTAKITAQHGFIYSKLIKDRGIEIARKYLNINTLAIKKYAEICRNFDCDFEMKNSYVYTLNNKKKLDDELQALVKLGYSADFKTDLPLPFETLGAIEFEGQAQFNPLKFVQNISKGLNIYENSFVNSVKDNVAITEHGRVKAKKIIVATHFPFLNGHGSYFLKMYQHRSYVIALENAQEVDGMYVDEYDKGMSFRNYKDLLLIGGGDHRTGKSGGNYEELKNFARKYYPEASIKYCVATQDCMTLDGAPYIGNYSKFTPDMYVATGFNKWGMTSSMVAAAILSDLVTGGKNEYSDVFNPSRSILKKQLLINTGHAVAGLVNFRTKRCSHLGCALKWNSTERTWDCSCHGSRFDADGRVIENPAKKDINI